MDVSKNCVACIGIITAGALQIVAWGLGFNGAVFAFTSSIIGGLLGLTFGYGIGVKSLLTSNNTQVDESQEK